jgi:hypothetical protein
MSDETLELKNEGGMVEAVKYLQNYLNTYTDQQGYEDYSVNTYVDDILYGLGVSINSKKYAFATGFSEFKKDLKQYLVENP